MPPSALPTQGFLGGREHPELSGAGEWTSRSQSDGDDLGGIEGVKPILWFLQPRAQGLQLSPWDPLAWDRLRVTNASFGGVDPCTSKPSCLFRLSSRLPWWEGSGHSYLWPHSEKQTHAEGPAGPPCSLGPWPPAPGYMSSEHHVFCKKRALLGWTGPAGPPRGGDSHLQAALIRQRTDLRGPQDRTVPKPCLWQKQSSYGAALTLSCPGHPAGARGGAGGTWRHGVSQPRSRVS